MFLCAKKQQCYYTNPDQIVGTITDATPVPLPFDCDPAGQPSWAYKTGIIHTCPAITKVGIGTSTPAHLLDVRGVGSFEEIQSGPALIQGAATIQGLALIQGNVGIGTPTPLTKLDVTGDGFFQKV